MTADHRAGARHGPSRARDGARGKEAGSAGTDRTADRRRRAAAGWDTCLGDGPATGPRRTERGSGSVLMVGAMGVVLALTAAGLHLGAAAVAAHRARAAADLSALAAASVVQSGLGEPCTTAATVARRHGVRLVGCDALDGERVQVRVSAPAALRWPGVPREAVASARAGPEEEVRR